MSILEIGPSFSPVAPKADGWNVRSIDHLTREGLVEKYTGHPGVDTSRIEEVDFVWKDGPLSCAVPKSLHGSFDAVIASHVIEHSPDLIGFLESLATLLAPDGVVALAVPDKRYCFDYFKPLTMTGEVLTAHAQRRTRHQRSNAFNHIAYAAAMDGSIAWGKGPVRNLTLVHSLAEARDFYEGMSEAADAPYRDMHTWHFTPSSLQLLLLELAWRGETDWNVERTTAPEGCEFLAWLRRGGRQAALALAPADLQARRLELLKLTLLETGEQVRDFLGEVSNSVQDSTAPGTGTQRPEEGNALHSVPSSREYARIPFEKFEHRFPTHQNAVDLFRGKWASNLGSVSSISDPGAVDLFHADPRPRLAAEALGRKGRFNGMTILELGPLEAGHTYQLEQLGAEGITAIEANADAFLKCLVVKEIFSLKAKFLLGDIVEYLSKPPRPFDLIFCSGVLYHMEDPVTLIKLISLATDKCFVWTHYYDAKRAVPQRLPRQVCSHGFNAAYYELEYPDRKIDKFWGGNKPIAAWMERNAILDCFRHFGFTSLEILAEDPENPQGANFSFAAARPA
ncbi:MAG: class I SAM-dependent methyltransferase [Acidobacteriaceae bacterium]|nr:class I SAM-dependent methyltransferase [Acidobacteriaceae bacterium]